MSTYKIRNDSLIDIGLNVDTSDLEAKMDEIDEKLQALSQGATESEMQRIVDEALQGDDTVRDLERRLDQYAQKVDGLMGLRQELTQKVYDLESKIQDQARQIESLNNQTQDAVTLLGLLRRAAEIILGR